MTMRNSAITTITPIMIQPVRLIGPSPRASNDGRAIYQCRGGNQNGGCTHTALSDRDAHPPLIPGAATRGPIDPFLVGADECRCAGWNRVRELDRIAAGRSDPVEGRADREINIAVGGDVEIIRPQAFLDLHWHALRLAVG